MSNRVVRPSRRKPMVDMGQVDRLRRGVGTAVNRAVGKVVDLARPGVERASREAAAGRERAAWDRHTARDNVNRTKAKAKEFQRNFSRRR